MKLTMIDKSIRVASAMAEAFAPFPEVSVAHGDICGVAVNTLVSPANSYGFMDGGVDRVYVQYFGTGIQERVQAAIDRLGDRMIPVGNALLVRTGHTRVPYLIVAPTMELPGRTEPAKIFFAMAAMLATASRFPEQVTHVFCPGMGTGVGAVDVNEAAGEMASAYARWRDRGGKVGCG